ncbi:MAG: phosphoadenylyl-sulfate reductase [Campylobacterota bacterium]
MNFESQVIYTLKKLSKKNTILTTSAGTTSLVLIDLLSRANVKIPVVLIDTGFLFDSTISFFDKIKSYYPEIQFNIVKTALDQDEFIEKGVIKDDKLCCLKNKVELIHKYLTENNIDFWISGVRRQQSDNRQNLKKFCRVNKDLVKVHPLLEWSDIQMHDYLTKRMLPLHPLWYHGFDSIGCFPCTKKGHGRTGRWQGNKSECGLHSVYPRKCGSSVSFKTLEGKTTMDQIELKLDKILLDGQDDRLKVLENGMTKYGCRTKPYPHLSYSSCTASTISNEAYTHVKNYFQSKFDADDISLDDYQAIRDNLRSVFDLKDSVDICLSSSGTDLEMLPYLFIPKHSKVYNVIVGAEEVGSGTLLAAEGRLFSEMCSDKHNLHKGDQLAGFEKYNIEIVKLPIREDCGAIIEDENILDSISSLLKQDKGESYYILHSVFHSKTGLIKPSPEKLLELAGNYKNVIVVIDACQLRVSRETINRLLEKDTIVFITGSKFFGAPTFSAAALISEGLRDFAAQKPFVPKGLNYLFGKELFPKRWNSVKKFSYENNLGLLLRWRAAIFEMQQFNSVSKERIIKTIKIFNDCIRGLNEKYQNIIIYSDINNIPTEYDLLMSKSILTIGFKDKSIDFDFSKKIYQELIGDSWLNKKFPYPVHLGQPVKIKKYNGKWLGTLRIALGSRFFVKYSGKVESEQQETMYTELEYIFKAINQTTNQISQKENNEY